jgi:hypothetical protein
MVKAVIFDVDGTLGHPSQQIIAIWTHHPQDSAVRQGAFQVPAKRFRYGKEIDPEMRA